MREADFHALADSQAGGHIFAAEAHSVSRRVENNGAFHRKEAEWPRSN